MDCSALKCFILGTKMLSFTSAAIVSGSLLWGLDSQWIICERSLFE